MRRLLIIAFTFLYIVPLFAQDKHPFTFEDMMKLKRVGEPVPSPDGKWVVFSVVDVDLAANKKTPHIWIVPLAGDGAAGSSAAERVFRMVIVHAGLQTASASHSSQTKKAARRCGPRTSIAPAAQLWAFTN
jgi:dipeptidyl aminopeptidase/acylaminoacyl peptidase